MRNVTNNLMTDGPKLTKAENGEILKLCIETFDTAAPDLNNPEEVENTIRFYFTSCLSRNLRPGNMGMYARLGISRQDAHDIVTGKRKINRASADIIKKGIKILAEYREALGSAGKLNPATLIFWQKNYDGLKDTQEFELSARSSIAEPVRTPEEIERSIIEDIPIDD